MNKGILFGIISVVILGLIFGLSKSASYSDESASQNSALTAFRECVQNSEAAFYGAFWCSHCRYQKTLLGVEKDSQMPFYVECSTPDGNSQTAECIEKAIQSYPTWMFADGTFQTGVMSLSELASKTGCQAPVANPSEL
jgi:hypothetical protein